MNDQRGVAIVSHAQTNFAIAEDMPGTTERAARLTTILMVGRIITQSGDRLCRIRNISSGGMLVECDTKFAVDEPVTIELRNLNTVSARVRWIREGQIGVQFDAPMEVEDLLHQPEGSTFKPRAPRLGASCPVVLWRDGFNRRATLIDVSQTGCRLELTEKLTVSDAVRITIPGLPLCHATLRWIRMGVGGFAFNEPLSFAELTGWDNAHGS